MSLHPEGQLKLNFRDWVFIPNVSWSTSIYNHFDGTLFTLTLTRGAFKFVVAFWSSMYKYSSLLLELDWSWEIWQTDNLAVGCGWRACFCLGFCPLFWWVKRTLAKWFGLPLSACLAFGKYHLYEARQNHSCNTCLGCMFSDGALVLEKVVLDLDEAG